MEHRLEEISIPNPLKTLPESQFLSSSHEPAIDPLLSDPHHAWEVDHSPQLHDHLQNLDIKQPEIEYKSQRRDSNEEDEEEGSAKGGETRESDEELEGNNERNKFAYPLRPDAEDCAYYIRTGKCKYGSSCKFNHPPLRNNQVANDMSKGKEDLAEKSNQTECKYYLRTGGCKYGDSCRYVHSKAKTPLPPVAELNFLGLPIRLGEKECPYYMRNGSCKFGANCKFNHPDPTAVAGDDPRSAYTNGVSGRSFSSQANVTSWSATRPLAKATPFMPVVFSHTQGISSQSPEWNGYQAPVYAQEQSMRPRVGYLMNHNTADETHVYAHHQSRAMDDEFPERPGQPECSYFLKTGDCKFKSNCKFHHPRNRTPKPPPCILSDKGLPLRPDQSVCAHYGRYGICKFGPACKYDHPIHLPSSTSSEPVQPSNNSPATEVASNNGSDRHIH